MIPLFLAAAIAGPPRTAPMQALCPPRSKLVLAKPIPVHGKDAVVLVSGVPRKRQKDDLWVSYDKVSVAFAEAVKGRFEIRTRWTPVATPTAGLPAANEVHVWTTDLDGDKKPEVSVECTVYGGNFYPSKLWVAKLVAGAWRAVGTARSGYEFEPVRGPKGIRAWKSLYSFGGRSRSHPHEYWPDYYGMRRGRLVELDSRFSGVYRRIERRLREAARTDPDSEILLHVAKAARVLGRVSECRANALRALRLARGQRLTSFRAGLGEDDIATWVIAEAKKLLRR